MKEITNYISEKLKLSKTSAGKYKPDYMFELKKWIKEQLKEQGPNADLNGVDVSNFQYLDNLFNDIRKEYAIQNIDISQWDVSNCTNMECMFYGCDEFDCDLSNWDVSKVTTMQGMFSDCKHFKGTGLDKWDVSKCEDFRSTFLECAALDVDLDGWEIKKDAQVTSATFVHCGLKQLPKWAKK